MSGIKPTVINKTMYMFIYTYIQSAKLFPWHSHSSVLNKQKMTKVTDGGQCQRGEMNTDALH